MIITFLGVVGLVVVLNALYFYTGTYRREQNQFSRLRKMPQDLECLTIGSGPALFAFDYGESGSVGYNMSIWPEDFRYDGRILRYYGKALSNGKRHVFHVICLLSFAENDYLSTAAFSERYVHALPPSAVDLPRWKYYLARYLPICLHPLRVCKALARIPLGREISVILTREDDPKINQQKRCQEMAKGWAVANTGMRDMRDVQSATLFQTAFDRNIRCLNEVYHTAQDMGMEYYAVLTPSSRYMLEQVFSKEFLQRFLFDNLRRSDIPAERIMNYLQDNEFASLDCYTSGIFLNSSSRKKFTRKVMRDVLEKEKD